jgi:hypothetical protein
MSAVAAAQDPGPLSAGEIYNLRTQTALRRPIRPTPVPAPPGTESCDPFVLVTDIAPTSDATKLATVATCLNDVYEALIGTAESPAGSEVNRNIIQLRINYKRLKKWIPDTAPTAATTEWLASRKAQLKVAQQLQLTLKNRDLFATFAAVLVTGATLVDASQPEAKAGDKKEAAADAKKGDGAEQDAQALGTIVWQSRHFGDESIRVFDWSIGGRIGVQPVLNLVTDTPAADVPPGENPPVVSAVHQNAFVWTAGVQMNKPIRGIDSEFGWYGSTGSSTLTSLPKAVDKGQGSFVAFPLDYGAQKTAWLWETGMTFNVFDNPLEQIHAEKGTTSPQFQALVGVRRDERFRGGVYDDYDRPTARLLFRLTLDAIRVLDRREFGEPSKPFTFGFVVEHERSLASKGLRVPSATRFVLRGDINLLRALSGTPGAEKKEKASEAPVPPLHKWSVALPGSRTLATTEGVTRLTVALTSLTAGGSAVETTPPSTAEVSIEKPAAIAIPGCTGATIQLRLRNKELTLSSEAWGQCAVTAAVLSVQEIAK